jgi:hypothetical protein
VALALARAHLRLGSLTLARAELEILAGQGALDLVGQVDLAEVRWRTGDLVSAGEAANVALGGGEEAPVALAIAAEAAAALGRPNEARQLAGRAIERADGPIDALFAGMPRSAVWPADAAEPPPTAGTLFHQEPGPAPNRRAADVDAGVIAARAADPGDGVGAATATSLTLGFWDADRGSAISAAELPEPVGELEAARAALRIGSDDEAALRFGLALRLAPALAPAILEATDGLAGPAISVVRGDAYRLVGLETEAKRAYAAAAWSGARDRRGRSHGTTRRSAAAERAPKTQAAPDAQTAPAPAGAPAEQAAAAANALSAAPADAEA